MSIKGCAKKRKGKLIRFIFPGSLFPGACATEAQARFASYTKLSRVSCTLKKTKCNTGNILPEIESMLLQFDYRGLTDQNNPINQIAMDIMRDDFYKGIPGKAYINIYQFKVEGRQFYLCDRAMNTSVETRRHACILATGKSFPLGFEITSDDYYLNNDCESVENLRGYDVRVEEAEKYEAYKRFLISLPPHCEKFSTSSYPVSFFSFPQDNILGYHVSGRQIAPDEAVSAISLIQRFP